MLEQLRKYFKNTSKEDILNEWKTVQEECSLIESPPVLEFIEDFLFHFKAESLVLEERRYNYPEITKNPSFTRIFLLNLN